MRRGAKRGPSQGAWTHRTCRGEFFPSFFFQADVDFASPRTSLHFRLHHVRSTPKIFEKVYVHKYFPMLRLIPTIIMAWDPSRFHLSFRSLHIYCTCLSSLMNPPPLCISTAPSATIHTLSHAINVINGHTTGVAQIDGWRYTVNTSPSALALKD